MRFGRVLPLVVVATALLAGEVRAQQFVRVWGRYGTAPGRFNFNNLAGIAVAPDGKILVADSGNHRIQAFLPDSTFLYQWGSAGQSPGHFNGLGGIAVDGLGNVYAVDTQSGPDIWSRVQKFAEDGTFLAQWLTDSTLAEPTNVLTGIAVDGSGNVFVGDQVNGSMKKFSPSGRLLSKWGTKGQFPNPGPNSFWYISGVAVDEEGNVYVADQSDYYVQAFMNDGQFLGLWGSEGSGGGGTFPSGGGPIGIGYDQSGHLYTTDYQQVQVFSTAGAFINQWGSRGSALGQFYSASAIAVSHDGLVYVLDNGNDRIQVFTSPVTPTRQTTWGQLKASYR